jgi:hypothetical protein
MTINLIVAATILGLGISSAMAGDLEFGDPVILTAEDPNAGVWVWKDKRAMLTGSVIIAQRLDRGEDIDEAWAETVTNCIVPYGAMAEGEMVVDNTFPDITHITITSGPYAGCSGVVFTDMVSPADQRRTP